VEWTAPGVGVHALVTELSVLSLITNKGAGNDHLLATDEDNLLASEKLLGDHGTETSVKMVTAVDEDGLFKNHGEF